MLTRDRIARSSLRRGSTASVVFAVLLIAAGAAAEPSGAAGWQAKVTPALAAATATPERVVACVVTLREPAGSLSSLAAPWREEWVAETVDALAADLAGDGVVVVHRYRHLPLAAVRVPAGALPPP